MPPPRASVSSWDELAAALQSTADHFKLQTDLPGLTVGERIFNEGVRDGLREGRAEMITVSRSTGCDFSLANRIEIATFIEEKATKYGKQSGYHFGLGNAAKIIREAIDPRAAH